jgi:hypothetical protein
MASSIEQSGDIPPSIILEGCSWGMIFYIGVYKALIEKFSLEGLKKVRFGGSSSGCLAALGACLGKSVDECLDMYNELAHIAEVFGVLGLMSVYHEIALRRWLPKGGDEYKMLTNRLYVNVTRFFCRSEVLCDWTSNDDVVTALHASMHIPFYMTYTQSVRGAWGIDGGFSANLFKLDENTITVTAMSSKGTIHPSSILSKTDCFSPPSVARRKAIFDDGASVTLPEIQDVKPGASDSRIPLPGNSNSRNTTGNYSNGGLIFRGKSTINFVRKPMLSLLRVGICSVFWTLRLIEAAPKSITLLAAALFVPKNIWASIMEKFKLINE